VVAEVTENLLTVLLPAERALVVLVLLVQVQIQIQATVPLIEVVVLGVLFIQDLQVVQEQVVQAL
jgi:hypothetical protein